MTTEKDKLQRIVGVCCGALCLAIFYYQFVISGMQLAAISKLTKESTALQSKLDKARENDTKLILLTNAADKDKPFLSHVESRIVTGDPVAWLWREMGDFADKRKMPRLTVVPEGGGGAVLPENESYESTSASLSFFCGYHKLGEFVRDLENSFSTLQIQHLEIVGGTAGAPDSHTIRVQFHVLAVKEDKSKDSAQGPKIAQGPSAKE
jgi:hypothetical protein